MASITRELLPNSAPDVFVEPPFHCDYGNLIFAGEGVFINFGCIILDGGGVHIGRQGNNHFEFLLTYLPESKSESEANSLMIEFFKLTLHLEKNGNKNMPLVSQ